MSECDVTIIAQMGRAIKFIVFFIGTKLVSLAKTSSAGDGRRTAAGRRTPTLGTLGLARSPVGKLWSYGGQHWLRAGSRARVAPVLAGGILLMPRRRGELASAVCRERHKSHVNLTKDTRHTSHIMRHTSHVTHHASHVIRHTSHVTCLSLQVTRHTSHVTRHTSHVSDVTRRTSHVTRHTSHCCRGHRGCKCGGHSALPGGGGGWLALPSAAGANGLGIGAANEGVAENVNGAKLFSR